MNIQYPLIVIILGLTPLAILPNLIQQVASQGSIEIPESSPAGLPQSNMTSGGGQANLTANMTGEQGMPSASPVGESSDTSCTITKGER
jgi:hypothetical protein